MNELTTIQRPAPLDNTKLHTPAEVRKWKSDEQAYWEAVRAAERQAAQKKEAEEAHANRELSEDEYWEAAVKRENAQRARWAERDAQRFAVVQRKQEELAASPEIATVLADSAYKFLLEFAHWTRRGYVINDDGPLTFLPPSLYHVTLRAPAPAPAKKTKAAEAEAA